jgi:putative NADH-flavin reductase
MGFRRIGLLLVSVLGFSIADAAEQLQILVYGASGKVGTHVLEEGLSRGHLLTAVSRDPGRITREHENLRVVRGDILDPDSIPGLVQGKDIVIISVRGVADDRRDAVDAVPFLGLKNVVEALRETGRGAARVIHVGGSGSLEVEPGKLFADQLPKFILPKHLELEIAGQVAALGFLRTVTDVEWTYATPAKNFTNGERTGQFRIGGDRLMEDARGRSRISRADFAVALVDEAENAEFIRDRFSVAY